MKRDNIGRFAEENSGKHDAPMPGLKPKAMPRFEFTPDGCEICGHGKNHGLIWDKMGKRFHRYEAPSDATRLARMKARQEGDVRRHD